MRLGLSLQVFFIFLTSVFNQADAQQTDFEKLFRDYLTADNDSLAQVIANSNDNLYSFYCQGILTADSAEQIRLMSKFIDLKPKFGLMNAYFMRGMAYTVSEKYDSALVDFNKAIALDPDDDAEKYYFRADAYQNLGKLDSALIDINKKIELDQNDEQGYTSRGVTYFLMERYDDAIADWKRVKKMNRDEAADMDEMIETAKQKMKSK